MNNRSILLAASTLLAGSLPAATLSINFGAESGSLATATESAGALSVSSPNWNNASGATGTLSSLKDETGAATAAALTWSSANTYSSSAADTTGNDNGILTKGYLDDSSSGYTATISGSGYFLSNVYLILASDSNASQTTNITLGGYKVNGVTYGWDGSATVAGVNSWSTAKSWSNQNTLTEGSNYLKVANVGGTIAIAGTRPSGGRSALAGVQVENAYTGTLLHWDINGATPGAGGATPSGNWDGATSNWSSDSTGASAASNWAANNVAVFSAGTDATGAYTVTVSGTQNARGLWFQRGNVTLTGGTVSLTNERAVVVDAGSQVIGSALTGDGALSVSIASGATLALNAANNFTGSINNSGTLNLGHFNAVQNAVVNTGSTSTLGFTAGTGTYALGGLTGSGNIALGANSLSIGGANANNTYSGIISGTGGLTKVGTGSLTLAGSNTYGGVTTINGGTLTLSARQTGTGGTVINNGGILDLTGGGGASGAIRGTVTVNSGGTLRLSTMDATGYNGDSTCLTTINLVGGTLNANTTANQTLGNAVINMTGGAITGVAGSALDFYKGASALNTLASGTTATISGVMLSPLRQGNTSFTVAKGATASGLDLDIQSVIRSSPSGDGINAILTKAGAGVMRLKGTNTLASRTFSISAGTLVTGNTSAFGTSAVQLAGGTLQIGDASFIAAGAFGTAVQTVTLGSASNITTVAATVSILKFDSVTSQIILQGGKYDFSAGTITLDLSNAFNSANTYHLISGGASNVDAAAYSFTGVDQSNFSYAFANGDLVVTAVPEPATYGLVGAGACAALAFVRRRRKAA